jgi:hypothetical protein
MAWGQQGEQHRGQCGLLVSGVQRKPLLLHDVRVVRPPSYHQPHQQTETRMTWQLGFLGTATASSGQS